MKKRKLNKIVLICLIGVGSYLLLFKTSLARYIYNGLKDYYFETKHFYFNSDKMDVETAIFQLDNWDGVNTFDITVNMNSFKNNIVSSDDDINYNINYSCSSKANCTITKQTGLIPETTHTDYFVISVTPNTTLVDGDHIVVNVEATSTYPYVKTIRGEIRLNVGIPGISYEISDKANRPYLDFKITNTLDFYRVVTAFGSYSVGDLLDESTYSSLSASDKSKCTSALLKLDFDPRVILIDMTSEFYENAYSNTTTTINGKEYINSVTFGMDSVSSMNIRFYKTDVTYDYTYPYVNPSSIITFNIL